MNETFIMCLGIIFLIFGVLQIVLFFKLWGMTNDVNELKNTLHDPLYDIKQAYLNGHPDIARKLLDRRLREIDEKMQTRTLEYEVNQLKILRNNLVETYKYLDLEMPASNTVK